MLVVLATTQLQAAPPLPGAIFTTLADGTRVNQNIYQAKCDVYLDGGWVPPPLRLPPVCPTATTSSRSRTRAGGHC